MPDERKNKTASKKVNKKKRITTKRSSTHKTKRRVSLKKSHFVQSSIIEPNSVSSALISPLHNTESSEMPKKVGVVVAQTTATSTKVALVVVMVSAVFFAASLAGVFVNLIEK